jgi:hypothetical protein
MQGGIFSIVFLVALLLLAAGLVHSADGAPRRRGLLLGWAGSFIGASAFIMLDPLGLSAGADRVSESVILAAAAPLASYPARDRQRVERPGQRAVTVVIVDDAFLAGLPPAPDQSPLRWPLSRQMQWEHLIAPILTRGPRALFLDWVFDSPAVRPGDTLKSIPDGMARMRHLLEPTGFRLFLADQPPALADGPTRTGCGHRRTNATSLEKDSYSEPAIAALASADLAERVAVRFWGPDNRYPLAPLSLEGPTADCAPAVAGTELVASPALALFHHWCLTDPASEANGLCGEISAAGKVAGYRLLRATRPLPSAAPRWLWSPPSTILELAGARGGAEAFPDCREKGDPGFWQALWQALRIRPAGRTEEAVPFNRCPGVATIRASQIAGLSENAEKALFEGRIVLVGVDTATTDDLVTSPVNGKVPGVLFHAVMVENLISDGTGYLKEPPPGPLGLSRGTWLSLVLAALLSVSVSGVLSLLLDRCRYEACGRWARLGWGLICLLVIGLAILVPVILVFRIGLWLDWAPANWLSPLVAKLFMTGGAFALVARLLRRRGEAPAGHGASRNMA